MQYQFKEKRRRKMNKNHNKKLKSDEKEYSSRSKTPVKDSSNPEPVRDYTNVTRNRFSNENIQEGRKARKRSQNKSRGKFAGIQKRAAPTEPTMHRYVHEMTSDEIEKNKKEQSLLRIQVQRDNVKLFFSKFFLNFF